MSHPELCHFVLEDGSCTVALVIDVLFGLVLVGAWLLLVCRMVLVGVFGDLPVS